VSDTKVDLHITEDYQSLSLQAAQFIFHLIQQNPRAVLCCATGSTPTQTYKDLAGLVREKKTDTSELTIVKLDEWVGLEPTNTSSCEYYLQTFVLKPLGIPQSNFISFKSNESNPEEECQIIRKQLEDRGTPIDLCIIGLGLNGHLGFNEPGTEPTDHAHVVTLTQETLHHTMLSGNTQPITQGMTLGLQDILDSKVALLLINGVNKQTQFRRLMSKEVTKEFPASYLWKHPNFVCFVDKVAFYT